MKSNVKFYVEAGAGLRVHQECRLTSCRPRPGQREKEGARLFFFENVENCHPWPVEPSSAGLSVVDGTNPTDTGDGRAGTPRGW